MTRVSVFKTRRFVPPVSVIPPEAPPKPIPQFLYGILYVPSREVPKYRKIEDQSLLSKQGRQINMSTELTILLFDTSEPELIPSFRAPLSDGSVSRAD
uniref:Uncharacterized protein n=1 Tax=Steinernema glaseri TaxID=37863 RepID=A0A1I8ARW7_9BILA